MSPKYKTSRLEPNAILEKVEDWLPSALMDIPAEHGFSLSGGNGFRNANFCVPRAQTYKRHRMSQAEIALQSKLLYERVLEALGGNEFRLSADEFSAADRTAVISALSSAGFIVFEEDFDDVVQVARAVRDDSVVGCEMSFELDRRCRHASLNCYDYDVLKEEMKLLGVTVGYQNVERFCPTLVRIVNEAIAGENNKYPGRHLPMPRISDSSGRRIVLLRLMDEILCTADGRLTNEMMAHEIERLLIERGIAEKKTDMAGMRITPNMFKKLYAILSEKIGVEHTRGMKYKYHNEVYEPGHTGHLYKMYNDKRRLSAYTVDISILEASRLRREIGRLRLECFADNQEYFTEQYPLLSALGYMENLIFEEDCEMSGCLNEVTNTHFRTLNYKTPEMLELKKKVESAVALRMPITVGNGKNSETVRPICIKEDRGKWVLIARSRKRGGICLLTPDELSPAFAAPELSDSESEPLGWINNIIGIGRLVRNVPFDVVLELTETGVNDIEGKNSLFGPLNPTVIRRTINPANKYEKGHLVSFNAYVNEDLLSELLRLDKAAKIIHIEPVELSDIYEDYFFERMRQERVPLRERKPSSRTLREPKAN